MRRPSIDRRTLAALALLGLVFTSGCLGFITGDEPRMERLNEPPDETYEWNRSADVHITVTESANFRAVYDLDGEGTIELFRRDGFGGRNPLDARSLRYQYPNGTVLNASEIRARGGEIKRTGEAIVVTAPSDRGQVAFTARSTPKRFTLPTYREGTYELILPPDRRIDFFLFGNVVPNPTSVAERGDTTVIRWDEVTSDTVVVQFYLQRDLYVFAAILAGLAVVAGAGVAYFRLQIRELERQREELGLDVDIEDDDFGDDPPPGMG